VLVLLDEVDVEVVVLLEEDEVLVEDVELVEEDDVLVVVPSDVLVDDEVVTLVLVDDGSVDDDVVVGASELDVLLLVVVLVVLGGGVGTHVASQPSPSAVLPSSQVSPASSSMRPSPHSESVASIGPRSLPERTLPLSRLQSSRIRPTSLTGLVKPSHPLHVTLIRVPCFLVARYCCGATAAHASPRANPA